MARATHRTAAAALQRKSIAPRRAGGRLVHRRDRRHGLYRRRVSAAVLGQRLYRRCQRESRAPGRADAGWRNLHRASRGTKLRVSGFDRHLVSALQFCQRTRWQSYITDIYREFIETPESIPEQIKKKMDFWSGSDRGRIYRIVPNHPLRQRDLKPNF